MVISWVVGTVMLWTAATYILWREGTFAAAMSNAWITLCLVPIFTSLVGLGFFAGAFTVFIPLTSVCRYVNDGPLTVGDHAMILIGPRAGTVARVYELVTGQGGNMLPRLDLGMEAAAKGLDLFEDYTLLRVARDANPNPSRKEQTHANTN